MSRHLAVRWLCRRKCKRQTCLLVRVRKCPLQSALGDLLRLEIYTAYDCDFPISSPPARMQPQAADSLSDQARFPLEGISSLLQKIIKAPPRRLTPS